MSRVQLTYQGARCELVQDLGTGCSTVRLADGSQLVVRNADLSGYELLEEPGAYKPEE